MSTRLADLPMAPVQPEALRWQQACALLVVAKSTFYELAKTPGFPAWRLIQGQRHWDRRELLAWWGAQERGRA